MANVTASKTAAPTGAADRGVLRMFTAGSVDDGKSTLIGRLLHDTQQILEDQYAALTQASLRRGQSAPDLSLLTDGLEAEREQGITIDVAYRYFATARRKFIIADTPGHEQYTRNMVTGASTADVAVLLADATKGLLPQGKRHLYIASLLGIRHVVVAVNKMDLVGYEYEGFKSVCNEFKEYAAGLAIPDLRFVPVSALQGDMVVERGNHIDWYFGPTLLEMLEMIEPGEEALEAPFRFPVQLASRLQGSSGRSHLGRIASGTVAVGDAVVALPSNRRTTVSAIHTFDGTRPFAIAGDSVAVVLADEIDLGRGDLIANAERPPRSTRAIEATLVWLDAEPLVPGARYMLKHLTRTVHARIAAVNDRVDVETLARHATTDRVHMNDIVHVAIGVQQPLFCDAYSRDRATGAFVLIDEVTNQTVAAGMIQ